MDIPALEQGPLPGVRIIEQEPRMLHVAFQGPVDPVLKWLAQFPVERITTPQTSLEQAFMQYYQPEGRHE